MLMESPHMLVPMQLEMGDGQHLTDDFVQGMIDEMAPWKQA